MEEAGVRGEPVLELGRHHAFRPEEVKVGFEYAVHTGRERREYPCGPLPDAVLVEPEAARAVLEEREG